MIDKTLKTAEMRSPNDRNRVHDELEAEFQTQFASKYKPEFAALAFEVLALPGTQEMLAKRCGVTTRTIQIWKNPRSPFYHKEFAESYTLGVIAQKAGYDEIALRNLEHPNKHFNPALYFGERKRLHKHSDDRLVEIPELADSDDYAENAKVLKRKFSEGLLTSAEFNKASTALHKISEVVEMSQLKAEVEELKSLIASLRSFSSPSSGENNDGQTETN